MDDKIKNLENFNLDGWDFDMDEFMHSICEKAVGIFLENSPLELWMPDRRCHAMDARISLTVGTDICSKPNPYVDVNITSFLSEHIKDCANYLREGDENEKQRLETMKADMLSLINQIDGELSKHEQANTKD